MVYNTRKMNLINGFHFLICSMDKSVWVFKKIILMNFIIILILSINLFASGSGKIVGKITDKETGEALIGVNVVIVGTTMGAATDVNGKYYIIGVPANTYKLKLSMIGYHTITVQDVVVQTDLTTQINVQLEAMSIQTPTVVVTARQEIIQKDITSTRQTVTREDLKNVPGLETTEDIFKLQGGTVLGNTPHFVPFGNTQLQVRDESVKDIHVRGGRGGEILFLIDGMPVTHPLYGGRSVLDLDVNAVQQVDLLTGGFNAEYGEAQSGVVNITTRTGNDQNIGGIEYKTDQFKFLGEDYNTRYGTLYLGGPEPITRYLLPKIGINISGKLYYFLNANFNITNTPYNNGRARYKIQMFGLNVLEEQDNTSNFTGKINWDITNNTQLIGSFNGSWKNWSEFDWLWKNYPDNTPEYSRNNNEFNILFKHIISPQTFFNIRFGFLGVKYRGSLNGENPSDFWVIKKTDTGYMDSSTVQAPNIDGLTGFYNGYNAIWRDDNTKTFTLIGDMTSQIHPEHLIKTGFQISYNDLSYIDIPDGAYKLSNYGEYLYNNAPYSPPPPGPFKEFGQYRWVFHVYPIIGSAYIQDKFEKEFLVINAGIRWDWFYEGKTVDDPGWKQQWQNATGMKPDWNLFKYKFSPRLGISFPIYENMVIYFSYGHFVQLPELQFFYRDPYSSSFTGNPKLDFEQTILYEFGLTYKIAKNWGLDIKSYTKDISQQVGTTQLLSAKGTPVFLYDNLGYGRARGIEFRLNKLYSDHFSGRFTYTLQWADGYSSSAFEDYIRSLTNLPNPIRERRLDWDIRHQIIFQGTIASPKGDPIDLFGFTLPDDWDFTILSSFSSGQPYTPGTTDAVKQQELYNTSTGPIAANTDIRFTKSFDIVGGLRLGIELDVFNVFNQKNVQIAYGFNNWTGKPYRYGDIQPGTNQYFDWYTMYRLMDPRQLSTGRYVKFGIKVDW
ncbi:MAG: TonB-dependent receptor [Ignavibacteriaceae bacterium]